MKLNLEMEWLTAGVNIVFCVIAVVCIVLVILYMIRNQRLKAVISDYQKKVKAEAEKNRTRIQMQESNQADMLGHIIPIELFELLQIKTEKDLSLEKQRRVQSVSLTVDSNEFSNIIHAMSAEEVFSFINVFMEKAIPAVYEAGGIVEDFHKAGMTILFLENPKKAVETAVTICEMLNELGQRRQEYTRFSIGITYESAIVGVVGARQRMNLLMLSEESSGLSTWLQKLAEKYYARILVAETYAALISQFEKKFHVRLLGYVYVSDTHSVIKVYDVFDGDEKEIRNRKRQTKMVFEKGVMLFAERKFVEARQYFIEVLKTDRFDRAAKEYVFRCEEAVSHPNHEQDIYIEKG